MSVHKILLNVCDINGATVMPAVNNGCRGFLLRYVKIPAYSSSKDLGKHAYLRLRQMRTPPTIMTVTPTIPPTEAPTLFASEKDKEGTFASYILSLFLSLSNACTRTHTTYFNPLLALLVDLPSALSDKRDANSVMSEVLFVDVDLDNV